MQKKFMSPVANVIAAYVLCGHFNATVLASANTSQCKLDTLQCRLDPAFFFCTYSVSRHKQLIKTLIAPI